MTNVQTGHPSGLPYVELKQGGRQISFQKDCLGEIKIHRQVNDGEPELLVQRTSTPYTDTDNFPEGTKLTYAIELDQNNEKHQYQLEVRL